MKGMKEYKRKTKRGRFAGIPFSVLKTEYYAALKGAEVKLLVDLLMQYNGNNNGNLSPCHTLLKRQGWARSSLYRAYTALVYSGFLVVTRQGWKQRGKPTLVAITWAGIDEPNNCDYDDGIIPSSTPLAYWRKDKSYWKHTPTLKPPK